MEKLLDSRKTKFFRLQHIFFGKERELLIWLIWPTLLRIV